MEIPRQEHPNPQFERNYWENLNGKWEFEIDNSCSGKARQLFNAEKFSNEIIVPFCPESKLSSIGNTDFMYSVWYRRKFQIKDKSKRIILHIGACDYFTTVYINGQVVGEHCGGYTSFAFDITDFVVIGDNTLVINAEDDVRTGKQPGGKQSAKYESYWCFYTRTTGIWQTVWLEYVPETHIKSFKFFPDQKNSRVAINAIVEGNSEFTATVFYNEKKVGSASAFNNGSNANIIVELSEKHLWEVGCGRLYDVELEYGQDKVKSYFGLRNVNLDGYKFTVNEKSVFQRTVLDQGYYPDGLYTAPSEEDMIKDINLSLAAGFNGARLHEKVFEPRFLYHCDKMGYLVWGEYANWGFDVSKGELFATFLREWTESVERDFNHPSIIGWCPFNETWDFNGNRQNDDMIEMTYKVTKLLDPTRPCIDTSGNFHVITDIFDFHEYMQDPVTFNENMQKLITDNELIDQIARKPKFGGRQEYKGEPVFASEYGGIKWDVEKDISSWGYGDNPKTTEEFIERYKGLTEALLFNKRILGFCYTQLYDVEQEKNGLYTYDRQPKFDMEIIKKINSQTADIEKE